MKNLKSFFLAFTLILLSINTFAQHSVARKWNEVLLTAIRNDYARPTVHARNLFHVSMAMYDSWAAYDTVAKPYFMGTTCGFGSIPPATNIDSARNETMSYAAYKIIKSRFKNSPGANTTLALADSLFLALGYDTTIVATNYIASQSYAQLGNFIGKCVLDYGLTDGSNEQNDYVNLYYKTKNTSLVTKVAGNPNLTHPNNWQKLSLDVFIDQSGNVIPQNTPDFLSPEWGNVKPFALENSDLTTFQTSFIGDSARYKVYHNPGAPVLLDSTENKNLYQWGFSMVSIWGAHLDPNDSVMIDISPASNGNNALTDYPTNPTDYATFYNYLEGGDTSKGRTINPTTNQPYTKQIVPRGDYARVLAEFWADGPDSETPPGHWFTIINYVADHKDFERKFAGQGDTIPQLEWDVKAYLTLAGAMHDAAITAWGIKGYYDYIRPISAIRYMAGLGQSSDTTLINYHKNGIPLVTGKIEVVTVSDPLSGANKEHVGKIKLYTWRGPDYIKNAATDFAGVGWILAENWWPYQRPSFVTPPFAGYVSGHSTYSRAAAEVLTKLTGSEYFPGGMGEFVAKKNEFLVFEEGPSQDITLQWATYQDASDECSLSRIWGGIHPPVDDIPGRLIGYKIGQAAYTKAVSYFGTKPPSGVEKLNTIQFGLYPNPSSSDNVIIQFDNSFDLRQVQIINALGKVISSTSYSGKSYSVSISTDELAKGVYFVKVIGYNSQGISKLVVN